MPDTAPVPEAANEPSSAAVAVPDGHPAAQEPEAKLYAPNAVVQIESTPAEALFAAVREVIQRLLEAPMKDAEVAVALDVSKPQAKAWLQRLVVEGAVEKQKKPAGYIVKRNGLFE